MSEMQDNDCALSTTCFLCQIFIAVSEILKDYAEVEEEMVQSLHYIYIFFCIFISFFLTV
jgi:hypothetical protein